MSTRAINSSYTGSDDNTANKLSDTDDTTIDYIKVKLTTLEVCKNKLNGIINKVTKELSVDIQVTLVKDGKYSGYFKIISESDKAIEYTKSHLLELVTTNNS
jgi:hypothetical protein